LEVGDGGTGFDFLRIVDLSPGELEATVCNLYQQWLLLARRTAQSLLQVSAHLLVSILYGIDIWIPYVFFSMCGSEPPIRASCQMMIGIHILM
jgi:hypothetical protein